VALALLERETIDGKELKVLVFGKKPEEDDSEVAEADEPDAEQSSDEPVTEA
jgi:hypothetical protein